MPDDEQDRSLPANAKAKALSAETAAINAEIAYLAATRKLADARAPLLQKRPIDGALAAAKSAAELAKSRKEAAESDLAWVKASIGDISASGLAGAVELGDKVASIETALLASKALAMAAGEAVSCLAQHLDGSGVVILVYPSGQLPDVKAITCFRACSRIVSNEFAISLLELDNAIDIQDAVKLATPQPAAAASMVPAIGLAVEAVSKILSYFRSDFKVAGTELDADHVTFAELVADALHEKLPSAQVRLPLMYEPVPNTVFDDFFNKELGPLANSRQQALAMLEASDNQLLRLSNQLAQTTDTMEEDKSRQEMLARRIARIRTASDRLKQVIQTHDAFLDSLVANKDTFDVLIRQYAGVIRQDEEKRFALTARVHRMGGSHYTEKNLWTLFGTMPFHVMGGAVVSCSLFDLGSGNLLASKTIPVHSGFYPVKDLAASISPSQERHRDGLVPGQKPGA
ncbi:hypothetical protein OU994_17505 [Pseudoduganella sp. SL102]|uniref:hypothetical protein n=1 Tax=Pseudoduganella sp. SL102 TaxID=2995154 RepID=UPI00248C061E|nr:hypothetical protein [Pseudoduganella sp. SL102]WBS00120.1 hypothetical protein OU994_17505 [Pseudoduganella sp. SL102]